MFPAAIRSSNAPIVNFAWRLAAYGCVASIATGCAFIDRFDVYAPIPESWQSQGQSSDDEGIDRVAFQCATGRVAVSRVELATHPYFAGPILPVIPTFFFPGIKARPPQIDVSVRPATLVALAELKPRATLLDERGKATDLSCSAPSDWMGRQIGDVKVGGYSFQVQLPDSLDGETFSVEFINVVEGCALPMLKFERKSFTRFYYTGF